MVLARSSRFAPTRHLTTVLAAGVAHKQSKRRRTPQLNRPYLQQLQAFGGGHALCCFRTQEETMLFTIAVILLVLWLLGLVSGYTLGNFIYVLLVIALVLFVVGLVSGRRTV